VSLSGGFGEVRLGRDYTPTFWNTTIFDAFGTNGLGDSSGIKQLAAGQYVRADNAIGYFLPSNIGGVYGQFMVAAAEATAPGRYVGGRVGFAAGPFDVAASYSQERVNSVAGACTLASTTGSTPGGACVVATGVGIVSNSEQYKTFNIGGSYDFGVVKLLGYYNEEKILSYKDKIFSLSAVVPLGQGEIHVGGEQSKISGPVSNKVKKFAAGYVYNLSKRTALYATGAIIDNDSASRISMSPATAAPTAGGKSKGLEAGLRHFF
jgi:predicted porin